jgi:GxxExxY protein
MATYRDDETYAVLGAAMEVHRVLGQGFAECVYHDALAVEFEARGIAFQRELPLTIEYKGEALTAAYDADFLCFDHVLVELVALDTLTDRDHARVLACLKACGIEKALLINFGQTSLQYRRLTRPDAAY